MKLTIVLLVALALTCASVEAKKKHKKNKKQPNFIFFLTDDLGYNDVGWHDETVVTPHLNKYAKAGLTLEQNYVSPVCTPSRGQLMTGKYAFKIGLQHIVIRSAAPDCAPLSAQYIPEALKGLGYQTHMLGKWHLGFCDWACTPTHRGFDSLWGFYQGYIDHYTHMIDGGYDWRENERAATEVNGTHATDLIRDRAIEMIQGFKKDEPFFMYVAWSAVHGPLAAPQEFVQPYTDAGYDEETSIYRGLMTHADDAFGQIMAALEEAKLDKNTVIVFSGDNGGEDGGSSNAPLRGAKATVFDGGIRSPSFVYAPGHMKKKVTGTTSHELISEVDWFATFYSMAGGKVSDLDIDGVDQTKMLMKGKKSARDEIPLQIDSYAPGMFGAGAMRVGDYKLIKGMPGLMDGYFGDLHMAQANFLKGGERMNYNYDFAAIMGYAAGAVDDLMLFNMKDDPEERTNLADSMPDKVAELKERLAFWQAQEISPDFSSENEVPEGAAANFGGIWSPGWCSKSAEE
jgi:arylsulfatase B